VQEPRGERRVAAEGAELPEGLQQRLLHRVGRVLAVTQHAVGEPPQAVEVRRDEPLEGARVPGPSEPEIVAPRRGGGGHDLKI
jgi:hypothetical protein